MRRPPATLLAILSMALLVLGVLAVAGGSGVGADPLDPSSRSAGSGGTVALHDWLQSLGFDVRRLSGSFDLEGTDVLIAVEPQEAFSDAEIDTLLAFLRRGGELVLAFDGAATPGLQPLLDRFRTAPARSGLSGEAVSVQPLDPGGATRRVRFAEASLDMGASRSGAAPLLSLGDAVVLAGYAEGSGRAYLMGSPYPLSNDGLRASRPDAAGRLQPTGSDAALVVLALLERASPQDGRVLHVAFDEVHHGEGGGGGASAVLVSPVGLAGLLAALIILAYLATSGRRLGRPLSTADHVPGALDFVTALAQLYERSGRRGAVADRYAAELKERVAAATGADPHADDPSFVEALRGFGEERAAEVARVLTQARALGGGAPSDAQLLRLAREVDAVEARWSAGTAG